MHASLLGVIDGDTANIYLVAILVVNLGLAWGVWGDARQVMLEGRRLYLARPSGWALTTAVTGIVGATAYWLVNRSTLRPREEGPRGES